MKRLPKIIYILFLLFFSCDVEDLHELCGKTAVINNELFVATNTANYSITDVKMTGNCLIITISSSGCNGNTWKASLIDSGSSYAYFPEQRHLKLSLETNEACLAIVTKEIFFDIGNLQTTNSSVLLNLDTWNQQIIYSY